MDNNNYEKAELMLFTAFKKAREENEKNGKNNNCGTIMVLNEAEKMNICSFGNLQNLLAMQVSFIKNILATCKQQGRTIIKAQEISNELMVLSKQVLSLRKSADTFTLFSEDSNNE